MRRQVVLVLTCSISLLPLLAQQTARGPGATGWAGRRAGFVQNATYDKDPPELPSDLRSGGVLIFSKTSGFREEAGIQASNAALCRIAQERGWPYFITGMGPS